MPPILYLIDGTPWHTALILPLLVEPASGCKPIVENPPWHHRVCQRADAPD